MLASSILFELTWHPRKGRAVDLPSYRIPGACLSSIAIVLQADVDKERQNCMLKSRSIRLCIKMWGLIAVSSSIQILCTQHSSSVGAFLITACKSFSIIYSYEVLLNALNFLSP